jgi:rare lipoprotein A
MKMKKLIYLLPFLALLFFFKGNNPKIVKKQSQKIKVLDTIKKRDSITKPVEKLEMYHKSAHASYYADKFTGRRTASGTIFHNTDMTCAHRKLPFGTKLKVTSLATGKVVYVTVTDRGPFSKTKNIDLSKSSFMKIAPKMYGGHINVDLEIVKK